LADNFIEIKGDKMKKMIQLVALSAVASTCVVAGGYKLPEQSLNSMALGAAYVAHTDGADTAYFNPANMAFMDGSSYVDGAVTFVHLPSNVYTLAAPYSGESKTENILVPNLHYVSKPIGDWRWGVSIVTPGGLSKRWDSTYQKAYAEEFTLKTVELNPSIAYKVSDEFSLGGGVRAVYSEGIIKNNAIPLGSVKVDMKGDSIDYGYNLAMTYKPIEDINIAATYRSKIDLGEKGTAIMLNSSLITLYDGEASVSVPLPAALNLAVSKTWEDRFTLEFNYERTYWSAYKSLNFTGIPLPEKDKNWKDTNTFRIGATVKMDNKITYMMGFALDETPVPDETISFELPDSDAKIFSMGFKYQQTESLSWGAAFLYDSKEPRSVVPGLVDNLVLTNGGSFDEGGAFLTTVGISYKY
jgi:long-chain fatty acid transport protein